MFSLLKSWFFVASYVVTYKKIEGFGSTLNSSRVVSLEISCKFTLKYRVEKRNHYLSRKTHVVQNIAFFLLLVLFTIGNAALNKSANNNKLTFKLRCNNVFKKGCTY